MQSSIFKLTRFLLLVLMPVLLLSGTYKENRKVKSTDSVVCDFAITNGQNEECIYSGEVVVHTPIRTFDGSLTVKFSFNETNEMSDSTLQMTIADQNINQKLALGTYELKAIESLFTNFEGVFVVANINTISELPFFATTGTLKFLENGPGYVKCNLDIKLKNAVSQSLHINGVFVVKKSMFNQKELRS